MKNRVLKTDSLITRSTNFCIRGNYYSNLAVAAADGGLERAAIYGQTEGGKESATAETHDLGKVKDKSRDELG